MSFYRENNTPDVEFYNACCAGDTATVRGLLRVGVESLNRSASDQIYGYGAALNSNKKKNLADMYASMEAAAYAAYAIARDLYRP